MKLFELLEEVLRSPSALLVSFAQANVIQQ